VEITVNGQVRPVEPGTTVAQLLESLGVPTTGVAVAVDRQVVPRSSHASTVLFEGNSVELIRAVGGG